MWSILQLVKFFVTTVSYEKMLVFFFLFHFSPNIKQEITMYVDLVLNSQYQTPEGFTEWPVATYKQNKILFFFFLTKALLSSIYHKKEKEVGIFFTQLKHLREIMFTSSQNWFREHHTWAQWAIQIKFRPSTDLMRNSAWCHSWSSPGQKYSIKRPAFNPCTMTQNSTGRNTTWMDNFAVRNTNIQIEENLRFTHSKSTISSSSTGFFLTGNMQKGILSAQS